MGDLWYVALAYGVIWLGLFIYLFRLAGQAEGLRREVRLLRSMLQAEPQEAESQEANPQQASALEPERLGDTVAPAGARSEAGGEV
jgi:CcmD family protein